MTATLGRVIVINGPNLGRLGRREPAIYGTATHADLVTACAEAGAALSLDVQVRQSDSEGDLIGWLNEAADHAHDTVERPAHGATGNLTAVVGVVLNGGALSHYSYALRDAVASTVGAGVPVVDVHLSNPAAREEFRHLDVLAGVATGTITGFAFDSYRLALQAIASLGR